MPGEPTTPLFSITDFISLEPSQLRNTLLFVNAGTRAILLVSIVARTPRVEVLDFEMGSEVFVVHWYSPLGKSFSFGKKLFFARNQGRARRESAGADGIRNASRD
jgi:hypothetical protein